MIRVIYRDELSTIQELSEISGITPATIRDRLRRGYSIEEALKPVATSDSIREFCSASYYKDWIGMPITDLYKIYWKWSVSNGYTPLQIQGFSRQLFQMYPMLKTVPTKINRKSCRVIRER